MMKRLPIAAAVTAAMLSTGAQAAYTDAGTDYTTARVDSHINDESFEPLQMVNMFLCIIKATGAETLWDQNYRALVDDDKCEQEAGMSGGDQQESGNRSSSAAVEYADVVVSSSRADDQSPQVVQAQYSIDDDDGLERYLVRTEVSTAPTNTAPFGELRFTWQAAHSANNKGDMAITSENGSTVIQMIDQFDEGGPLVAQRMRVQIDDAAGTSGSGVVEGWDWGSSSQKTFRLAYNSQYLLKDDGTTQSCLARPGTATPTEKVWGYSLFREDTGALLDIEAGFGFRYVDAPSGETRHGFIGTWGMWTENEDSPTTITHEDTNVDYTVVTAPGKLIRQRKGVRGLIDGETFEAWTGGSWQVVTWDGAVDERFEDSGGADAGINVGDFLWSSSLRQDVNYQGDHDSDAGTPDAVAFATREVVQPGDALFTGGPVTLTCFGDCPKANVSKTDALAWNLYDGSFQDPAVNPGTDYTLDPADMTLKVSAQPVKLNFTRDDLAENENFWGASVGEFVLQADAAGITGWDDLNAEGTVTYRWEYGIDPWSQLTLVKDGDGNFFQFDKPMNFPYTHAANSKVYMLEYQGARNLHGIPWEEVSGEWQPEINIPTGTQLVFTDGQGNPTNYRVKQVGIEKRMAVVASSNCASLTLPDPSAITLPTFLDADVAAAHGSIENEAFFTGLGVSNQAPRVIHGVVQD